VTAGKAPFVVPMRRVVGGLQIQRDAKHRPVTSFVEKVLIASSQLILR